MTGSCSAPFSLIVLRRSPALSFFSVSVGNLYFLVSRGDEQGGGLLSGASWSRTILIVVFSRDAYGIGLLSLDFRIRNYLNDSLASFLFYP